MYCIECMCQCVMHECVYCECMSVGVHLCEGEQCCSVYTKWISLQDVVVLR